MINLLDDGARRDLKAARLNVVLLTYCAVVGLAVLSVLVLVLFSHWWLDKRIAAAHAQTASDEAGLSSYNATRAQSAAFSANLGKIQSVLNDRSHYATALLNIAASLPAGASIDAVTLSPAFVTTPLSISATTPTYSGALALKQTLAQSPVYTKVSLDSANCGGTITNTDGTTSTQQGCAVSITATLSPSVFTLGSPS